MVETGAASVYPNWIINIESKWRTSIPLSLSLPASLSVYLASFVVAASIIKYILSLICTTANKHKQADGKHGPKTHKMPELLARKWGCQAAGGGGNTGRAITVPIEGARSAKSTWKFHKIQAKSATKMGKDLGNQNWIKSDKRGYIPQYTLPLLDLLNLSRFL